MPQNKTIVTQKLIYCKDMNIYLNMYIGTFPSSAELF